MYSKSDCIEFYAEPQHSQICREKWKDNTISFQSMKLMPKWLFYGGKMALRDALSCLYVIQAFFFSQKSDILVFSLAYPFAQNLIFLLSKLLNRKNIFVCLHGEMEVIIDERLFKSKKYQNLTKKVLRSKSDIRYIVLGESIFNNMKHSFIQPEKVIVIEHPYEFNNEQTSTIETFKPLLIGQIGLGELSKGTEHLFELAELLKPEIETGKLKIQLVGKLNAQLQQFDNGLVEYETNFLSPDIFDQKIRSLHFTLQLVSLTKRKVTASGSFFDSLKHKKPYLSLDNDYIRYFHNLEPDSGRMFSDLTGMAEHIRTILNTENSQLHEHYDKSVQGILRLQQRLSLSNIAETFKRQI
ncbi:MAG: hypothetical protein QM800_03575 [Paludibacter sp.]